MPNKPKKPNIDQREIEAFHQAVKDVRKLPTNKIRLKSKFSTLCRKKTTSPEKTFDFNEVDDLSPVRSEEFISYKQTSVSNKILRKLRKAQYNVDATLDLHGLSVKEAKETLEKFLQYCIDTNMRVVLIIHGKGTHSKTPILKNKLNHWLRRIDCVLAFCSALTIHGSRGAMYILLKRSREIDSFE